MKFTTAIFNKTPVTLTLDPRTQILGFSFDTEGYTVLALLVPTDTDNLEPRTFVLCAEDEEFPTPLKQVVGTYFCLRRERYFMLYEV